MGEADGAIIAASIAGSITIIASVLAIRDNNRRKQDELFFKALDFLEGGSQNRNLGIAAIGLSLKNEKHKTLCISLLIGSAIYLLKESKQGDSAHEIYNLERIMDILVSKESMDLTDKNKLVSQNYEQLKQTIREVELRRANNIEQDKGPADTSPDIETIFSTIERLQKMVKAAKQPGKSRGLDVSTEKLLEWEKGLGMTVNS